MTEIHDPNANRPHKHAYLTDRNGLPLSFEEIIPNEGCSMCSRGGRKTPLGLVRRNATEEVVHCMKCDHQETRQPRRQERFRPMNSSGA